MEIEVVERFVLGLVGAAEADEVGCDDARAARQENRDHAPVQVRPGRLAVQAQERALALAFVDVVHAPVAPLQVTGKEAEAGQLVEALIGRAHGRIVEWAMDYSSYSDLKVRTIEPGILEIVMGEEGKLAVATARAHAEMARIWLDIDRDPDCRVAILRGAGKGFSAGGDLAMVEEMTRDFAARARVWREARDLVFNMINCSKIIVSAVHGPAVGAGLAAALMADISIAAKNARLIDGHTRLGVAAGDHAAIIWPLLCGMAKAKYYLLTCDTLTGEEAERIGLVSLCVDDDAVGDRALEVATRLSGGAQSAIRWTKQALNNWYRSQSAILDASLAYEFIGFAGPDAREGLASHTEKRAPRFDGPTGE